MGASDKNPFGRCGIYCQRRIEAELLVPNGGEKRRFCRIGIPARAAVRRHRDGGRALIATDPGTCKSVVGNNGIDLIEECEAAVAGLIVVRIRATGHAPAVTAREELCAIVLETG